MDIRDETLLDEISEDWLRELLRAVESGRVITRPGGSAVVDRIGDDRALGETISAAQLRLLCTVGFIGTEFGHVYLTDPGALWLAMRRPPPESDAIDLDVSTLSTMVYCPEATDRGNWYTLDLMQLSIGGWAYLDLFLPDGEDDPSRARLLREDSDG